MVTGEGAGRWSLPTPFIDSEQTLTIVSPDLCAYTCVCARIYLHSSLSRVPIYIRSIKLSEVKPSRARAWPCDGVYSRWTHSHVRPDKPSSDPHMFTPTDPYPRTPYGNLTPPLTHRTPYFRLRPHNLWPLAHKPLLLTVITACPAYSQGASKNKQRLRWHFLKRQAWGLYGTVGREVWWEMLVTL